MDREVTGQTDRGAPERRAVTAFFDDRAAAQAAVDDLVGARVARSCITLVEGGAAPDAVEPVPSADRSIWSAVKDLFMADEDRHAYGEGLSRGGFLVSVMTGAADHDRVVEILDREGAVDMDARQNDWELQGWDPVRAAADLHAASSLAAPEPGAGGGSSKAPSAVEPSIPVGPAFPADQAGAGPRRSTQGAVVRDDDAEGLRLRTYVESRREGR